MKDRDPAPDLTVNEAVKAAKGIFKFLGYALTILGAVWYLRGYLDTINGSLRDINRTLAYKASISDVNHALKLLSDQNRDVAHKDGSLGLLVPELLSEPMRPAAGASEPTLP